MGKKEKETRIKEDEEEKEKRGEDGTEKGVLFMDLGDHVFG